MTASAEVGRRSRVGAYARRTCEALVLRAHRIADRLEKMPAEFGKEGPVDETDAHAVTAEWLRCLRRWADDNPEEVFAVKAGAGLLAAAVLGLWILVAMVR